MGFEPMDPEESPAFKTGAFVHSANLPNLLEEAEGFEPSEPLRIRSVSNR